MKKNIPYEKLLEAAKAISKLHDASVKTMNKYRINHPRGECSTEEEQRMAYLGGVAKGLSLAVREFK